MFRFVLVLLYVTFQCDGHPGLLKGILSDAHNTVHNVAGAVLGGFGVNIQGHFGAGGQRQPNKPQPNGEQETVVVIVEEQNGQDGHKPNNNYGYHDNNNYNQRPGNQQGQWNGNYNQHEQQHNPYGNQNRPYGNQNNGQYGNNGNYGHNGQYGNNGNYGHDGQYMGNEEYGNDGQYGNKPYGNNNPYEHNKPYGNNNGGYGNNNGNNGNNNGDHGNNNGDHGNNNGNYGNNNGNYGQNTQRPNQNNQGYNQGSRPDNGQQTWSTTPKTEQSKPTYGSIHENPTENPSKDKTTEKDEPLFVPLNPNEYVYGGDKITINAPKRETDDKTPASDADEDVPIDIRFQNE